MELDEFKNLWTRSANQISITNYNIAEIIYRDSKGPLAMLEKKFKASLYIFPFVIVIFTGTFISKGPNQSPVTWLLFTSLFIEFLFSLFNYVVVKKIQQPAGNIKENLLKRVFLLEKRYQNYLYIHLGLYTLMAVLLELSMHFHWDANFNGWATVSPLLRIAVYIVFLAAQSTLKRSSQKRQYGRYIDKLNALISQME